MYKKMPQSALQFNAVIRVVLVTKTSGEPQLGRNRQEDFGSDGDDDFRSAGFAVGLTIGSAPAVAGQHGIEFIQDNCFVQPRCERCSGNLPTRSAST